MWRPRKASIQIIAWSCGCLVGWEKFHLDESPSVVLNFVQRTFTPAPSTSPSPSPSASPSPTPSPSFPTYLAFDRACQVLRALPQVEELKWWIEFMRFLCDGWHFEGHSVHDALCRKLCNPAPLKSVMREDLVVPLSEKGSTRAGRKKRYFFRRAWNTQVPVFDLGGGEGGCGTDPISASSGMRAA